MPTTVREQILDALVTHFTGTAVSPYTITWSAVTRSPLAVKDRRKQYALSIMDEAEEKEAKTRQVHCSLTVAFMFWAMADITDNPSTVANTVLGEIQKKARSALFSTTETPPLEGKAVNIVEVSNDLMVDSEYDRQLMGRLVFLITYRHALADPTLVI